MRPFAALPGAGRVVAAALALSAAVIAGSLYVLDRQVEHQFSELQAYAAGDAVDRLSVLLRDEGGASVAASVRRAVQTASEGQVLLLTDAGGRPLAGNLNAWPRELTLDGDWETFRLPDRAAARAITARLANGDRLLVGQTDRSRWSVRWAISLTAGLALASLAVVLAGSAGVWSQSVRRRLEHLGGAALAIAGGAREARLPVSGRGDPFDDLAKALNLMVEENARLVGGLTAITHSLAHDLRTPLMRMTAAVADARESQDSQVRERRLDDAQREADHVAGAFTGLIDLALADSGLSREAMETVSVVRLVQDLAELFEPLAEDGGLRLALDLAPVETLAHRQLLMQAVANLLDNAIKHAPAGGEIEVRLAALGPGLQLSVRDHGAGLSPGEAAAAVRPFVRLGERGGLGLGLAIVEAVARLHEGAFRLEPAEPGLRAVLELWTHGPPSASKARLEAGGAR